MQRSVQRSAHQYQQSSQSAVRTAEGLGLESNAIEASVRIPIHFVPIVSVLGFTCSMADAIISLNRIDTVQNQWRAGNVAQMLFSCSILKQ